VYLSDDPVADFARYDAEQARKLAKLPTCQRCGDAIQQERAVCIEGFWYCDECLESYRKEIDFE
jgi:formylmethanofuran dehydrogenase subunit E